MGRRGARLGPRRDAVPRARAGGGHRGDRLARAAIRRTGGRRSSPRPTATASRAARGPSCSPSSSPRATPIVVAGAHGKTTTAAMIAFVLDRLGLDPAYVIGGDVPQLGGNAGAGRAGSSSRATSPTARSPRSGRASPWSRTSISTTTASSPRARRCRRSSTPGSPRCRTSSAATSSTPVDAGARRAGRAQPPERGRGARGARGRRCRARGCRAARSPSSPASAAASSAAARRAASPSTTTTRTTRPKVEAAVAALRETAPGRVLVLFQPHLPSRTRHVARELGAALAGRGRRRRHGGLRRPRAAAGGRRRADGRGGARSTSRPGMPVAWTPDLGRRRPLPRRRARAGDVVATVGAGDVDRAVPAPARGAAREIEEGVALSPLHHARHRRPGALVRAAGHGRGARGGARLGGRARGAR